MALLDSLATASVRARRGRLGVRQEPARVAPQQAPSSLPLIDILRGVAPSDTSRLQLQHDDAYMHLSSLFDMCARQVVIAGRYPDLMPPQTNNHTTGVMWALGRSAESYVREYAINALGRERVFGNWICPCGKTRVGTSFGSDTACPTCGNQLQYAELRVTDDEAMIQGSPDFLYMLDSGAIRPVEIKSIKSESFVKLNGASHRHQVQVSGYHRLMSAKRFTMDANAAVLYVAKQVTKEYPFKEFLVNVDSPSVVATLDIMWEAARTVRQARVSRGLPARVCTTSTCQLAKTCSASAICFGM